VKGTRPELEGASKRFDGHALSLTLLGKYLVAACGGDVRQCDKISSRLSDAFDRIMEAYEGWLKGKPDLSILQLIGLFDRPATTAATTALIAEPPIEALTSGLQRLSEEEWRLAVSRLRADRLLDPEDPEHPDCLDCHPLVRRHFAEKIKRNAPAAWKEANGRLYEYYRSLPTKDLPETLDEMTPLFAAIRHGCEAGRHQEAWDDVYLRRTRRYGEFYSTQKLGAFGADLAALACFFDPPWRQPAAGLDEPDKGVALNEAGEALRALGRLKEAVVALEGAERHNVSLGLWKIAAVNAGNLSQLFLSIGDLERALSCGCKSVELAERSSDIFQRMVRRCDLANALHHSGRIQEAKALFEDAEQIQKGVALALETQDLPPVPLSVRWEWQSRLLHAVRGFQYCDLLLGQGRSREVLERAAKALEIDQRTGRLLHVGLDHLVAGRAHLMQTMEQRTDDYAEAAYHLEQALAYLRQCGRRDYLPRGLTARVELHRTRGVFKDAQLDLDEAISIANWDGMALHQADCHLEYARLYLAMDDKAKARQSFSAATRIVETTGYHRRDGELELIGASL
jgi:tetratricopeptide (TPR) repeat protein